MSSYSSTNSFGMLFTGLLYNLLIMLLSAILPLIIGIGLTILVSKVKKKGLRIPLRIVGAALYSLAPVALTFCFFFNVFGVLKVQNAQNAGMFSIIFTITLSHLGYFMMCYDDSGSIKKNIIVNILGLFSSTFLWSMVGSLVGAPEVINTAKTVAGHTYEFGIYIKVLFLCFIVLAALNIPRMILKEVLE